MFLRKLTVIVVPLVLALALCLLLPLLSGLGFFTYVLMGLLLGIGLALLLPLSGAGRKKEPFAGLLWIPTVILLLVMACQYLLSMNLLHVPVLAMLAAGSGQAVLVEAVFVGFMALTCLRTRK